jgi:hypothetical protein
MSKQTKAGQQAQVKETVQSIKESLQVFENTEHVKVYQKCKNA